TSTIRWLSSVLSLMVWMVGKKPAWECSGFMGRRESPTDGPGPSSGSEEMPADPGQTGEVVHVELEVGNHPPGSLLPAGLLEALDLDRVDLGEGLEGLEV